MSGLTGFAAVPATVGFHWLPAAGAEGAGPIDRLFMSIGWLGLFMLVLLVGLGLVFVIHFRRREPDQQGRELRGEFPLFTAFAGAFALGAVAALFNVGTTVHLDMATPPSDAYALTAEADSGRVTWIYPNGHRADSLHVPAGRPVAVTLEARDDVYSLTVPAFRVSRDLTPGVENRLWFEAVEPGDYDVFAVSRGGARQASLIRVDGAADFENWLITASDILAGLTPVEGGRKLYEVLTCITCHSLDGSKMVGPSFKGMLGTERVFADGGRAVADADYVRRSLDEPQAQIVAGYEPVMPTFQGRIGDREFEALMAFMTSLDETVQ